MFKKLANLLLVSEGQNNSEEHCFVDNLYSLLVFMDSQPAIDIFNWLHISAKFYDHLRSLKTKNAEIVLSPKRYETIKIFLMFPFKYSHKIEIHEVDIFQNTLKDFKLIFMLNLNFLFLERS